MTVSDKRMIVRGWRTIGLAALAILAAGCAASPGGRETAAVAVTANAPRGFVFHGSVVLTGATGLLARGSICRTLAGPLWPGQVSLELLDPGGAPAARTYRSLTNQARAAGFACTVYSLPTSWRPQSGQTLRLSAG